MNPNETTLSSWARKAEDQLNVLAEGMTPNAINKTDKLAALKPTVLKLRERGYTYEQIAPLLAKIDSPICITWKTLRRAMAEKRRKKREKREIGETSVN